MAVAVARSRVLVAYESQQQDERELLPLWQELLTAAGYVVRTSSDIAQTRELLARELFDIALIDSRMRDHRGRELESICREIAPTLTLLKLVSYSLLDASKPAAVPEARDFVTIPLRIDDVRNAIERALDSSRHQRAAHDLRRKLGIDASFDAIVGNDPQLLAQIERSKKLAQSDMPVLIVGESGVGKELVAEAIHAASPRSHRSMVPAFLATEPLELQLSTLFGHLAGSFTNAMKSRNGLFREANGSSLFLDEVGDIIPSTQTALLRAVDKQLIRTLGAETEERVDVRIIAATNRNLQADIAKERFRFDLYQRLGGDNAIVIPPLRERINDVPLLVEHFARKVVGPHRELPRFDDDLIDALSRHSWPGNVRELELKVKAAIAEAGTGPILRRHFPLNDIAVPQGSNDWSRALNLPLEAAETHFMATYLRHLADRCRGNIKQMAELAGVNESTIRRNQKRCLDSKRAAEDVHTTE